MARKKTKSYPESFRKEAVKLADLPDRIAAKSEYFTSRYSVLEQYEIIPMNQFRFIYIAKDILNPVARLPHDFS